ncbi:MAG: flagellar biosynthetic protein FliO [Ignavibacteriaceae bacterium]
MGFYDIVKVFFPLILIVGLLYIILHFVKKSGFSIRSTNSKLYKNLSVKVISSQMIMPKKFISIVKIKDKFLVLGVSENSINMLKEFDDENEYEEQVINEKNSENNFLSILKKNLGFK